MALNPRKIRIPKAVNSRASRTKALNHYIRVEPVGPLWEAAKVERNWLVWLLTKRPGKKPGKVPVDPLNGLASDVKVAARLTYGEALQAAAQWPNGGIGYLPREAIVEITGDADGDRLKLHMRREASVLICVDLDRVIDKRGNVLPQAEATLDEMLTGEAYTECSPSGLGLHILLGRGDIGAINKDGDGFVGLLASEGRFFTFSGDLAEGFPSEITDAPRLRAALRARIARWAAEKAAAQAYASEEETRAAASATGGAWRWFDRLTEDQQSECVSQMLAALPTRFLHERNDWRDVTFALRSRSHLFAVWDEWSRISFEGYDAAQNLDLWDARERSTKTITIGSLIRWAEAAGWDAAPWRRRATAQTKTERGLEITGRNEAVTARLMKLYGLTPEKTKTAEG